MNRLPRWFLYLGFSLLIFGCKLWLIDCAGTDLPTMDQWDGEGEVVFRPWLEGRLSVHAFLQPHNEHRLITTKLFALGLLMVNGQWSNHVETIASGLVHVLSALVLLDLGRRWLSGIWFKTYGGLLLFLFALPFSFENTLSGFQVQFYFLLLFSLGHLLLTLRSNHFSWRWALGQLCGILAVATLASGFFSAVSILLVLSYRRFKGQRTTILSAVTAVIAIALAIVGWEMHVDVPGHAVLRAHSLGEFGGSLLQLLAWPGPAIIPVAFAPVALYLALAFRRRSESPADPLLLALIVWSILQSIAVAYGRGGGTVLISRYFDLLTINLALGLVVIALLFSSRTRTILAICWVTFLAGGLIQKSLKQWHEHIEPLSGAYREQEALVRGYVLTSDPAILAHKTPPQIPYPDSAVLQQRLDTSVRRILPPSVRRPVPLRPPIAGLGSVPGPLLPTTFSIAFSTLSSNGQTNFHWRSINAPDTALDLLRFRVAGDLGAAGRHLSLVVKSPDGEAEVRPDSVAGNRWKNVTIVRPRGVWWVEAADADPNGWFAFTEPVEVSRGTWLAEKLLKSYWLVLAVGALLVAASEVTSRVRRQSV